MSSQRPLVINEGELQQLQSPDDLDIPLVERVCELERRQRTLVMWLMAEGFDVPEELVKGVL